PSRRPPRSWRGIRWARRGRGSACSSCSTWSSSSPACWLSSTSSRNDASRKDVCGTGVPPGREAAVTGAIGRVAIALALALSCYGVIAAVVGGRARRRAEAWRASARGAAYAVFMLYAVATFAMVYALVTHDFSVQYVAQVGS